MGNEHSTSRNQRAVIQQNGRSSNYSNVVHARGNADARIVDGGNAAVAMANGPSGRAAAYTTGKEAFIYMKGNGKAGVDGGMAWAVIDNENMAVSYCDSAQKRSRLLGGSGLNTQARICNCADCRDSCTCPCHYFA